jgi:hypothetical protein
MLLHLDFSQLDFLSATHNRERTILVLYKLQYGTFRWLMHIYHSFDCYAAVL